MGCVTASNSHQLSNRPTSSFVPAILMFNLEMAWLLDDDSSIRPHAVIEPSGSIIRGVRLCHYAQDEEIDQDDQDDQDDDDDDDQDDEDDEDEEDEEDDEDDEDDFWDDDLEDEDDDDDQDHFTFDDLIGDDDYDS